MSDIVNQAMDLIRDEMAKNHDNPGLSLLGDYLTERLQQEPGIAGTLLKMKTPLKDGFEAIRDHARKIAKGGWACVDDKTGFGIACKKWGIPEDGETQALAPVNAGNEPGGRILSSPTGKPGGMDALDLDALLGLGV